MERLICLVIGYCFGLFQTGYLYSKAHNVDIKKEGSGNSGSTNVLRVMGVKAGAIVFLGDCFKTVFICQPAGYGGAFGAVCRPRRDPWSQLSVLYAF